MFTEQKLFKSPEKKPFLLPKNSWLDRLLKAVTLSKSRVKIWNSQNYLDRLEGVALSKTKTTEDSSPRWSKTDLEHALRHDIRTLLDEYVGFFWKKHYPLYGKFGVDNQYPESVSDVSRRLLVSRKEQGLDHIRAELDYLAACWFEGWLDTAQPGEVAIQISPRGGKSEGYPGTNRDNYVFINVYTKTDAACSFTQYLSFDFSEELMYVQELLQKEMGGQAHFLPCSSNNPNHLILSTPITFSQAPSFEKLDTIFTLHEKDWPIKRSDLPDFDTQAFATQAEIFIEFCLSQTHILLEEKNETTSLHYDCLISAVKELFTKWVEDHAVNYEKKQKSSQLLEYLESGKKMQLTPPYLIPSSVLKERWQHELSRHNLITLTKEGSERASLLDTALSLSPHTPLLKLGSLAHCITGTPLSLVQSQLLLNPSFFSSLQLNSLSSAQIAQFVGQERAKLWKPDKTCISCSSVGWVGECGICLQCEMRDSLVNFLTPTQETVAAIGSLDPELVILLNILRRELIKPSIGLTDFITTSIISPQAFLSPYGTIAKQLDNSSKPFHELESIVFSQNSDLGKQTSKTH